MKNTYLIILSFLFTTLSFGQSIEPLPGTVEHKDATRSCLVVMLDPSEDELVDAWSDFLKAKYGVKLNSAGFLGTGNLYEAKEVVIPAISSKAMDFYSNIEKKETGTELKVFAAFGYDMYVTQNETPDAYVAMKRMIADFLAGYLPNYYQEKIDADEKRLKKLTKAEEKLTKKLEKNKEKVEKLEKEIAAAEEEQKNTLDEKNKANETLDKRRKRLENVLKQLNRQ